MLAKLFVSGDALVGCIGGFTAEPQRTLSNRGENFEH